MKKLLYLLTLVLLFACTNNKVDNSEATADATDSAELLNATNTQMSFGELISEEDATDVTLIPNIIGDRDSLNIKLAGVIEKTCKMKGCWMTVKTGDSSSIRVTFKDYGFFVPKEDQEGKFAIFEGILSKTTTSVATLKHYAQDEGKSAEEINAITEPKEEFAFVANGVLIND